MREESRIVHGGFELLFLIHQTGLGQPLAITPYVRFLVSYGYLTYDEDNEPEVTIKGEKWIEDVLLSADRWHRENG